MSHGIFSKRIGEHSLSGGGKLYTLKTATDDVMSIKGSFLGGHVYAKKHNPLLSEFVSRLLDKGTKRLKREEVEEKIESRGISLDFSADSHRIRFSLLTRKKFLAEALDLLFEMLSTPRFDEADIKNEKIILDGEIDESHVDTYRRGSIELSRVMFDRDHPNFSLSSEESKKALRDVSREKISDFYKSVLGVGSFMVSAVGDINPQFLENNFNKFSSSLRESSLQPYTFGEIVEKPSKADILIPDKASVDVFLGLPLNLTSRAPDYIPLSIAVSVLGFAFASRFWNRFREELGISYRVFSALTGFNSYTTGNFLAYGSFAPENALKGKEELVKQVKLFAEKGVSKEEFLERQSTALGLHAVSLSDTGGLSRAILSSAENGYGKEYIDIYPKLVSSANLKSVNDSIKNHINTKRLSIIRAGTL